MWPFKKAKRKPPPIVPTDEVVPLHYLDDLQHNRGMLLDFTYRFDDALDADKLKIALERLLELEGWWKLGARLRLNANDKLEYHIPGWYHEKRPGFLWYHKQHQDSIEEHPHASQLPRAKERPTVFGDPSKFHVFAHPRHPSKIDDWLFTDKPVLSVCVWTFTDATLLTLSFSHTLLDAPGRSSLLYAWSAVLNGREHEVPRFIGFKDDPIDQIVEKTPSHKHILANLLLTSWSFLLFVLLMILENLFHPKIARRTIQIPDSYVQRLKSQALKDIEEHETPDPPFLSDGDILFAWWARLIISCLNPSSNRTINLSNVMGMRGCVDYAVPKEGAYIGNFASTSNTYMPAKQLLTQSLGLTALQIRKDLMQQRTTEQVEAYLSLHKECVAKLGRPPLFGYWDQMMLGWSNWHQARFFGVDFSGAVVQQGCSGNNRGKPSLITVYGHEHSVKLRNAGPLIGRDNFGHWWIQWAMRSEVWPLVEEKIETWAAECEEE